MSTIESTRQLVVFSLGAEEHALPITHVQEIIRYAEPSSVACAEPWLRGVIGLRGKIVPVVDLAPRLGPAADEGSRKNVIVESAGRTAGVVVGEVAEVLAIDDARVETVPAAGAACLEGIVEVGERLVILLAPDALLPGAESAS